MAAVADLKAAAREAWLYGLPLIEVAATRARGDIVGGEPSPGGFVHKRDLAGPEQRGVTTPNADTLYSTAFIDLAAGPATITLPASGERYLSLQIMDAYTNTFAVLGTRTTGPDGGTFTVVGPQAAGAAGSIRAPTPLIWLIGRILADDEADLPAACAVQDGLRLETVPAATPAAFASRAAPWEAYFASVQALVVQNPPPATDAAFFRRVRALGLSPGGGFDPARFDAEERAQIEAGVAEARGLLTRRGQPRPEDGWVYPLANLGDYRQDYVSRAGVALAGLGALTREEAMYMRAVSPDTRGFAFDGEALYRLSFPAGRHPPVDAFWSMSLYEVTDEGQLYFVPNRLGRYAIGDRTAGLAANTDGSLDIWIGRADPGGARTANWLPAPASGPYMLTFRAYLPRPELLAGRWRLPAIQRA